MFDITLSLLIFIVIDPKTLRIETFVRCLQSRPRIFLLNDGRGIQQLDFHAVRQPSLLLTAKHWVLSSVAAFT